MLNASKKFYKITKVAFILSIGFFIGFFASQTKNATENPTQDAKTTESVNLNSIVSYTTGNGILKLNTSDGNAYVIHADNTIRTFKANECIPLVDIAYAYKTGADYWCFQLKDLTCQLDNRNMLSYRAIAEQINSRYQWVTWNDETHVYVTTKNGDEYTVLK